MTPTRGTETRARPERTRLDQALVERGLAPSRERARALVLAREVEVDGEVALRAAAPVRADSDVRVRESQRYVSRGGTKLEGALARTGVDPRGLRCLDVGASTGGFTDCLLQHGAAHVTAVDVGYGQLAASLRDDLRVTVVERTNARHLEALEPQVDLAVIDVSFISLTMVLPAVLASVRLGGDVLALVKPQFEAGRDQIERGGGGVIRDPIVHASTVAEVATWAVRHGVRVRGVVRSSLLGPAGNREFFLWLRTLDAAQPGTEAPSKGAVAPAARHEDVWRAPRAGRPPAPFRDAPSTGSGAPLAHPPQALNLGAGS